MHGPGAQATGAPEDASTRFSSGVAIKAWQSCWGRSVGSDTSDRPQATTDETTSATQRFERMCGDIGELMGRRQTVEGRGDLRQMPVAAEPGASALERRAQEPRVLLE